MQFWQISSFFFRKEKDTMKMLMRYFRLALVTILFGVFYVFSRIVATIFPSKIKALIKDKFENDDIYSVDHDDFVATVANGQACLGIYKEFSDAILYGEAETGQTAPNPPVIKMDDLSQVKVLDLAFPGRPLVLNFGSCSWPPFMEKLATMVRISQAYESVADFVTIYIVEAHATDGWHLAKNPYAIHSHKNMQDRLAAAKMLDVEKPAGKLVVDTMSDEACKLYRANPERLCIVLDGVIKYYGGEGPHQYRPAEVERWLQEYSGGKKMV